jgi:hypothetical protein
MWGGFGSACNISGFMGRLGMATFFFHFFDGENRSDDEWGLELAGTEQAYLEAVAAARAMWPELLAARIDPTRCRFEVTLENGEQLFSLEFSELLDHCRSVGNSRSVAGTGF